MSAQSHNYWKNHKVRFLCGAFAGPVYRTDAIIYNPRQAQLVTLHTGDRRGVEEGYSDLRTVSFPLQSYLEEDDM